MYANLAAGVTWPVDHGAGVLIINLPEEYGAPVSRGPVPILSPGRSTGERELVVDRVERVLRQHLHGLDVAVPCRAADGRLAGCVPKDVRRFAQLVDEQARIAPERRARIPEAAGARG